jgi:mono/diheme cytochrome c family protein
LPDDGSDGAKEIVPKSKPVAYPSLSVESSEMRCQPSPSFSLAVFLSPALSLSLSLSLRKSLLQLFLFALLLPGPVVWAQMLEIISPKATVKVSLKEMREKLETHLIKIDDPVYGATKEYDAFYLPDVLQLAGADAPQADDELVLTAVDGYAPNMSFDKLKAHKAYLAYQEHATPGRFGMLEHGKAKISPWPFYLVWGEGKSIKEDLPWPYQLVKIEVVNLAKKFPHLIPGKAPAASDEMKGFALFRAQCLRCHSINLEGGEVGPELNIPKNVTEYWKKDTLEALIKDASSFRAKSKMPAFPSLSREQIDQILAYLKAMKKYKTNQ